MSFVELDINEDFESAGWNVMSDYETGFRAQHGVWTMAARHEVKSGIYIVELFHDDWPVFEDGFHYPAEARGAILALRQVILQMGDGYHEWLQ